MRRLMPAIFLFAALSAGAQTPPAGLQPLPEAPPPPAGAIDPALEPQVSIVKRGESVEEQFRVNGKLYMIKVTPPHGVPYYLIESRGDGTWTRHDTLDAVGSSLRVPMWVIGNF